MLIIDEDLRIDFDDLYENLFKDEFIYNFEKNYHQGILK